MTQSLARTLIITSLVLSSISFILSLIAFCLTNWKSVQLRSISSSIIPLENNQMDPLIRGEVEKYTDILYRHGQTHSFGLSSHCIVGHKCGRNLLPTFHETNYGLCHNIKYHQQCIFTTSVYLSEKCTCQKPSYINTTHTLVIIIMSIQILFFFVNFLRLYRYIPCLNDLYLRLIAIISTLFSSIFLIIIIIQQNNNRLYEPLAYLETMREHYSTHQIYSFTHDLELIIKQITSNLDVHLGTSYICIILILILTIVSFFTSSTVEIKILSTFDDDERKNEQNNVLLPSPPTPPLLLPPLPPSERFVPYEQIRFSRQTKV
ncbi:unnamed protein product [Adineta steineri]|uniref:Uncharacterized protein n=1 Tax=Adineta steineri TaxID=433720 RepID=A0A815A4A3_9BILA|nr:unnamed protein product [Adineta steineri]CAF1484936.1 unnamed protein product [Adineta steineri]